MTTDTTASRKTPLRDIIAYATGDGANSLVMNTFFSFAMMYYTKALGMSGAVAGIIGFIIMFWDAITDPLMGHISDNTRSRFGRRHVYILIGGILTVAGFYAVWAVPASIRAPELRIAACGTEENTPALWDPESGEGISKFQPAAGLVSCMAFSPDGEWVVAGNSENSLTLFDTDTGEKARDLVGHTAAIRDVVFSPDSKRIASAGDDATIRLWDPETGETIHTLSGHVSSVRSVAFSPDGKRVVSGGDNGMVRLWDAKNGEKMSVRAVHLGAVHCVAFSPDDEWIVSGGDDAKLKMWPTQMDAEENTEDQNMEALTERTLAGHQGPVRTVAFSPNRRWMLSGSEDGTMKFWDAGTGELIDTIEGDGPGAAVGYVAFSRDSRRAVSWTDDQTLRLWSTSSWETMRTMELPESSPACAFHSQTKMALFWYLVAMNLLLRTGSTIFGVPYIALGFEVCTDYNQRTTLQGVRTAVNMAVNLIGPAILVWSVFLRDQYGVEGSGVTIASNYERMGLVFSVIALAFVFYVVFATRKYAVDSRNNPEVIGNSLRDILRNLGQVLFDPFPRMVFFFISVLFIGVVFVTSLQMYVYVDFMLFAPWQKSLVHGSTMVAAGFGAMLAATAVRRLDKKPAIYTLLIAACCGNVVLVILFAGGIVPTDLAWGLIPVAAIIFLLFHDVYHIGATAATTIANSMMADVSEISRYRTGRLRDGSYSAMLSFVLKMSISLGLLFCGFFLDWAGFQPDAVNQTPDVARNLMYGAFLGGSAITLLALVVIAKYPVTREYMEQVQAALADGRMMPVCGNCGHDLTGHAEPTCPACRHPVADLTSESPAESPTKPPQGDG